MLPVFESGRDSDFALLKIALDSLLNNHNHLSEQYKYQVLLSHLRLPSALQLAKAYMRSRLGMLTVLMPLPCLSNLLLACYKPLKDCMA